MRTNWGLCSNQPAWEGSQGLAGLHGPSCSRLSSMRSSDTLLSSAAGSAGPAGSAPTHAPLELGGQVGAQDVEQHDHNVQHDGLERN